MHILPKKFFKIRYYGILSTKQKDRVKLLPAKEPGKKVIETRQESLFRFNHRGIDLTFASAEVLREGGLKCINKPTYNPKNTKPV